MKYPVATAHGDAGEFFFAFQIASVLKWPCRLFDIDIGIDAQVEILAEDQSSTGRFVAFQVKTTNNEEKDCSYVTARQLAYWRELELPVFVVLVDLVESAMFLHRVSLDTDYPVTESGAIRVDFDRSRDRFMSKSGRLIAAAAEETALSHVRRHLQVVQHGATRIRELIASQEDYPDARALIDRMDDRDELIEELARASALVAALRVGSDEYAEVEAELEGALQALRDDMEARKLDRDWDDDGRIIRFIREGR